MVLKINKEHLKLMKKQLSDRMRKIQREFREEEKASLFCWNMDEFERDYPPNKVLCELDRTYFFMDKIDDYLDDENLCEIEVNSEEWFNEWTFKPFIEEPTFDRGYMFPKSCKYEHTCDSNIKVI